MWDKLRKEIRANNTDVRLLKIVTVPGKKKKVNAKLNRWLQKIFKNSNIYFRSQCDG